MLLAIRARLHTDGLGERPGKRSNGVIAHRCAGLFDGVVCL